MPARLPQRLPTTLAFRPRQPRCLAPLRTVRNYAEGEMGRMKEDITEKEEKQHIPHVSEEDAAIKSAMHEQGPDIDQGTKVSEVVKGDKEAQANLPKVMQDAMKKKESLPNQPAQTRPYSTMSRARMSVLHQANSRTFSTSTHRFREVQSRGAYSNFDEDQTFFETPIQAQAEEEATLESEQRSLGTLLAEEDLEEEVTHKFGLPTLPLPPGSNLRKRYEPIVDQVTKLLMQDGKLSVAQRNMNTILTHLRTSPAPRADAKHPLLPTAPPHSMLPLNPTLYLTLAIDSVAPIFRIRSQRGAAGGGVALQLPVPLRQRQRRRTAVQWMLDAADKRKGGTSSFAKRFAEEIVAVAEGKSSCWTRRDALHAMGIRARANLTVMAMKQRR